MGIGKALAPTLANNPNAGFHEYAGAIGGGGIDKAPGGSFYGKGYDYGDRIGGLIGSLAETGLNAFGRAGTLDYVRQAAGVHAAGTVIGGWIGYGTTGTFDGALAGAEYGDMAGNIASSLLVACFTGDTRLVVPEGLKRIDAFREGDLVGSRSEHDPDGPLEWKRVLRVFQRLAPIVELQVAGRILRTTLEHPFRPVAGGWTPAGELELGQLLVTLQGAGTPVESLRATGEMATVYNLEVEDHHTYFVSGDDWGFAVWAHNAGANYAGAIRSKASQLVWMDDGSVTFQGKRVQVTEDLTHLTNERLMEIFEDGFAPRNIDGDLIHLHHFGQRADSPLWELGETIHLGTPELHPLGRIAGVGLTLDERAAHDVWRGQYWQHRAAYELMLRGF